MGVGLPSQDCVSLRLGIGNWGCGLARMGERGQRMHRQGRLWHGCGGDADVHVAGMQLGARPANRIGPQSNMQSKA